jgi:hypothetical protein
MFSGNLWPTVKVTGVEAREGLADEVTASVKAICQELRAAFLERGICTPSETSE